MADLPRPFGPYLLLKSLGTGGTGDVFLARPRDSDRGIPSPVVIKRLHGQLASQGDFVRRFQHEATLAVAIDSPHVAKVYDAGRVDETFYIAMEYVAGWPVSRLMKDLKDAGGAASIASAVEIVRGALGGLAALHGAKDPTSGRALGIVHRDVAPKNLMLGEDGVTRLIDLGLGKSTLQDWRTSTGVVMGSPGYMAPEQVIAEGVDQRCDLYAAGVVLWEILTLKRYIRRAPIPIMLRAQVKPSFVPPSTHRPDVPAGLDEVCKRALDIDPNRRFQVAEAFIEALDEVVPPRGEDEPVATIVGEMLWGELGQAKTEVTKLLSVVAESPAPAVESVEIFAERPEVGSSSPVGPDGHRVAAAGPGEPPTPTPMHLVTPIGQSYLEPPARGVPAKVVVALMVLTLLIGVGATALVLNVDRGDGAKLEANEVPLEAAPAVVADVKPSIRAVEPKAEPEPAERETETALEIETQPKEKPRRRQRPEAREASEARQAGSARRSAGRIRRTPPPATPPDPPKRPPPKERLNALIDQARVLRKQVAGTPKEKEVLRFIARASQEVGRSEVPTARVAELAAELAALAR